MTTFTRITVWRSYFSFRLPFSHNLASRSGAETLLLRLTTADGRVGYGQVLPRDYLSGETLDSALADIRDRWWPRLRELDFGESPASNILLPLFCEADRERRNAAFAGIDVAVRSALGYFSPESGFANRLGKDKRVGLVGVIPAMDAEKAGILARILKFLGYRRFKVKVGSDADADARRLEAVRRIIGQNNWLAVDANAAWEWEEATRRMRDLKARYNVDVVEEPLVGMGAPFPDCRILEKLTGVHVMADESLVTTADADQLIEHGTPSWWNIRLAKNGGFMGVNALAGMARKVGVTLYGGILVGETGALAAASRMAFFETGVACGEYGFSRIFLKGDPFRGSPAGYSGYFTPPEFGEKRVEAKKKAIPGKVVFYDGEN